MNLELINNKIKEMLPEKRYKHSLNVADCAVKLSEIYGCDKEKAYIAGIANDCDKYLNKDEVKYYVDKYKIVLKVLISLICLKQKVFRSSLVSLQLNTQHYHCCSLGHCFGAHLIPTPGTSTCLGILSPQKSVWLVYKL